jgi:anti-sigma regulatory factor (Ser/Thr protein kinase)
MHIASGRVADVRISRASSRYGVPFGSEHHSSMLAPGVGEPPAQVGDASPRRKLTPGDLGEPLPVPPTWPEEPLPVPSAWQEEPVPIPPAWPGPERGLPWGHPDDGRLVARHAVTAEAGSCKQARDFAAGTLRRWGMAELCRDAVVVISELVTNALRHARLPEPGGPDGRRPVEVILSRRALGVVCAVTDPCRRSPVLQEPDYAAESGRGLHVVASLSDTWGWLPLGRGGKAVWAVLGRTAPAGMASCEDDNS